MKKNVLIFSLLNWESKLLHRSHMLAKYFAKKGFEVFYVQKENVSNIRDLGFKPKIYKDKNIHIISLLALPYLKGKVKSIYSLNDRIMTTQLKEFFSMVDEPLIILESPYWIRAIENSRGEKGILCYDISDDFSQFATNDKWKRQVLAYEKEAIDQSDFITITAEQLREKAPDKTNVYLVENGVDLDEFADSKNIFGDKYKKPVCGFIGGLFQWIDFDLISRLADKYRDYSFVLIGPTDQQHQIDKLCQNSNVYYLGEKDKADIGNYFASLDIGLIPFVSEERYPRLKTVNSNKIFQYCYFGYPVISTQFEQVKSLTEVVQVCKNQEEFIEGLGISLESDTEKMRERRKKYAYENSWEKRVEDLINIASNR